LVAGVRGSAAPPFFRTQVIPYLLDVWLSDYARVAPRSDIIETTTSGCSFLFDVTKERLVAAWCISQGRHAGPRDKSRMAGHPLSDGPHYHRGHAIPHTLGGPTDINLVPQLGAVNVGAFRELERKAVATPGALYFTYWLYAAGSKQKPAGVDQGMLVPGGAPSIIAHKN
jgi:hypothetical protein